MRKTIKRIVYVLLLVILLCGLGFLILNSNWFRMWRMEKQLSDKYGISFDVTDRESDRAFFSKSHTYDACSENGVRFLAECSWNGKLTSDSYAHYYYAEEMNSIIEPLIKDYLNEFYIVRDCWQYGSDKSILEFVNESDSTSFDNYIKTDQEVTVTFRVYLKKNVKAGQLKRAMESLKAAHIDYSVYFLSVTDDIYDMVTSSGIKCYYPSSGVPEMMLSHSESMTEKDVENILANPSDVTVAQYIPKYDRSELLFSKNISRDYFINLDKNYSLNDIFEEIGPYGMEGSGIIRFVWGLNDGSKAEIIFDSKGEIIFIYIQGKNEGELIFEKSFDE